MARVQIFNGLLSVPTFQGDLEFVHMHHLRRQDGSLVTGSYTGEATWIGETTLVLPGGLDVERVEVLDATQDSRDRADGYFHGRTQKRDVAPKNKSEAFVDGWREGRAERRPEKSSSRNQDCLTRIVCHDEPGQTPTKQAISEKLLSMKEKR